MINNVGYQPPISDRMNHRRIYKISELKPLNPFRYAEDNNIRWFKVRFYDNDDGSHRLWNIMEYNYDSMIRLSMREKSSRGLSTYSCNKRGLTTGRKYV